MGEGRGEGKRAANFELVFARVLRLSGAQASFLRLVSSGFPGIESTFKIVELRESEVTHLVAGLCAAHARAAVHQVSLVLLEPGDFLRKIRRVYVDVDGSRNMACLKLLLRSHIEHDVLLVRPEFFKLGDIDAFESLGLFLLRGGLLFVPGVRGARGHGNV